MSNCTQKEGFTVVRVFQLPAQIAQLKDLSWADSASNILFLRPPGLGKTTLAVALAVEAVSSETIMKLPLIFAINT
ncbi:ATP-binding protein [Sphaerochaeta sp. UBA5849]|jgi:DNA replication protein DnaC|uniref:ATP-binding protein n=1 Tax=Sphaerochaeta sp. UBA5849 TaxID=1947475 RepID=UPI0031F51A94